MDIQIRGFTISRWRSSYKLIIKLMSYLPVLRRKPQNKFANPLAGMIYDNKKYTESCVVDPESTQSEMLSVNNKSKSIPNSFFKAEPSQGKMGQASHFESEKFMKTSKVFNLSKRLSNHMKPRCSKSKFISNEEYSYRQTSVNKQKIVNAIMSSQESLSADMSSQLEAYKFSEIDVLVLDLFVNASDIDKKFKLNLKKYFEMYFKGKLPGIFFKELINLLEKHIQMMAIEGRISEDYQQNEGNNDPVTIFTKKGFYMKLLELQNSGKDSEIYELIKRYCLPKSSIRAIFLQDIINLVSIQMFEAYNQSRDNEYVLMNSKGRIIKDFAQIKFSTKSLFISVKSKAEQNYLRYLDVIKNSSRMKSKTTFRETLRQDFRNNVVQGNIEESPYSNRSIKDELSENKRNIMKAESMISTRNDKTTNTRSKFRQFLLKSGSNKKQKTMSSISQRKSEKVNEENFSINNKIIQQYKLLRVQNDYSQNSLKGDQVNRQKIILEILILHCVYFKTKTTEQCSRILYSLQFIEKDQKYESYKQKMIDIEQYNRMRNIINCLGPKETIIHFIDRYLGYDEYGQINKAEMKEKLTMVIGVEGKTTDVILKIIWLWLERNGVIVNQILRRDNMTSMYEKNKLVYYFLIALIFGTNQTSAIELAQEILI